MSLERIRSLIVHTRSRGGVGISIPIRQAEALRDAADAARALVAQEAASERSHEPSSDKSFCLGCINEWPCPYESALRALNRLDED